MSGVARVRVPEVPAVPTADLVQVSLGERLITVQAVVAVMSVSIRQSTVSTRT
jgi:hypothetical protein